MKELTPKCWPDVCPAIVELTPGDACTMTASCPTVVEPQVEQPFEFTEFSASMEHPDFAEGVVAIIGKKPSADVIALLRKRTGPDELVVVFPKGLLRKLKLEGYE